MALMMAMNSPWLSRSRRTIERSIAWAMRIAWASQ
jgi:hypothetical protein